MDITQWRETTYNNMFKSTTNYVNNLRATDKKFTLADLEAMLQSEYDRQGQAWDGRGEVVELSIEATIAAMQHEISRWKKDLKAE